MMGTPFYDIKALLFMISRAAFFFDIKRTTFYDINGTLFMISRA